MSAAEDVAEQDETMIFFPHKLSERKPFNQPELKSEHYIWWDSCGFPAEFLISKTFMKHQRLNCNRLRGLVGCHKVLSLLISQFYFHHHHHHQNYKLNKNWYNSYWWIINIPPLQLSLAVTQLLLIIGYLWCIIQPRSRELFKVTADTRSICVIRL